ncbi:MAG: type IV secretion system protein [Alphaproteobacteria bacterium]|nr:type IV secretion system protein [Alphaproteobacteria bacterium]MBQ9235959.1 type IV secretion system protein [Alphaproteobacteria bacterium]
MTKLWQILGSTLRILLIVLALSTVGACGRSDDGEDSTNSVACDSCDSGDVKADKDITLSAFTQIFDVLNEVMPAMQRSFTKGAPTIMMVAFVVWLALRLLKFASGVTEQNIGEVWNEILRKAFICTFCGIVVSSPAALNGFLNVFVMPIFTAFLDLGVKILEASTQNVTAGQSTLAVFGESFAVNSPKSTCQLAAITVGENGFSSELSKTMSCIITYLKQYIAFGADVGKTAMNQSGGALAWIIGVVMYVLFWVVKVTFVFYIVDNVFQMAVIVMVLPIFVIAYAFDPTKKWAGSAFKYIIMVSAFLMCFSVICAMVVRAMIELIKNNPSIFNPSGDACTRDVGAGFMSLLLIAILLVNSMGTTGQLTAGLIGASSSDNFQKKLKAVAQMCKNAIVKGLKAAVSWGSSTFPDSMIDMFKQIREKIKESAGR